jgi:hypothetical protein
VEAAGIEPPIALIYSIFLVFPPATVQRQSVTIKITIMEKAYKRGAWELDIRS